MIIPGINCRDFETAAVQAKKISEFSTWAHIDVSDGVFTPSVSWGNLEEFSFLATELPMLRFEVHLMIADPEKAVEHWFKAGAERVIVHFEAIGNPHPILETAKKSAGEVMLAINPSTPVDALISYFNPPAGGFSAFQILAVSPGPSGQEFNKDILEKIKFLREKAPNAIIEVDGGINPGTAKLARKAGANILVSTSYIMDSPDPRGAYEELSHAFN